MDLRHDLACIVTEYAPAFVEELGEGGTPLPDFNVGAFEAFTRCGDLATASCIRDGFAGPPRPSRTSRWWSALARDAAVPRVVLD
jgi:hypothetical protein